MTKRWLVIGLVALVISGVALAGEGKAEPTAEKEYTGTPISLDLRDAPLDDILRLFHEISGMNFIIHPDARGKPVTIDVDNAPWDQVLDMLVDIHGLELEVKGNVYYVRGGGPRLRSGEEISKRPVILETRIYIGRRNGKPGVHAEVLPVGGPLLVIDSAWAVDWAQQEKVLQETFGLHDVSLVAAPKIKLEPGEEGTVTTGTAEETLYELTFTAWPGGAEAGRVRIRSEFVYHGIPFYETEVIATPGKPYVMGGREESTGEYVFLSVTPRVGDLELSLSREAVRIGTEGLKEPQKIQHVSPKYPEELLRAQVQGMVVLDVLVDETGLVRTMEVLSADDNRLVAPAKEAVGQWKYEPTILKGEATPVTMVVKVQFKLQ